MQYNYYNPTNQQPRYQMPIQQQLLGLKGRPVASIEEARAATIDFDGSIFFFPDLANKKIYNKQINVDGTMSLNVYDLKVGPTEEASYVTREEFENAMNQIKQAFAAGANPPVEGVSPSGEPAAAGKQYDFKF